MSRFFKRITSIVLATVIMSGTVANAATYSSWQPAWATYRYYDDAWMAKTCSFRIDNGNFEGIMGIFPKTPHTHYIMETGSNTVKKEDVEYITIAECVYVDSSGNEHNIRYEDGAMLVFDTIGPYQMYLKITGAHSAIYNGTRSGGATFY